MNQKCPYCGQKIENATTRKKPCPNCQNMIYVRAGKLVTEDEANTIDWVETLENFFSINRKLFEKEREELGNKFGKKASAKDTVWKILNQIVVNFSTNNEILAEAYGFMADLLADEDRDPTKQLIESAKARKIKEYRGKKSEEFREDNLKKSKLLFLKKSQLDYVKRLAMSENYEKAEDLLYKSEPTPAVLEGLRNIASKKAKKAKENGEWVKVISYLEEYEKYANHWREYCINTVNQEPPEYNEKDKKLLQEAKSKIQKQ